MAIVNGTSNSETLNALDGVTNAADVIYGYGGNDTIYALGGADLIYGGSGADAIYGGSGTDTSSYSDSTAAVTVSLVSNTGSGGYAEGDTLDGIENLIGSSFDDFLIGNDSNNVLTGLGGNDTLKGGGGADTLYGDSGADMLKGGGGADTLNGGSGIDTASYYDSGAGVFVSLVNDFASGGDAEGDELNSIENLTGSAYDDDLWGNDDANVLRGNNGEDTLKGFGGDDTLHGGAGDDTMIGGLGNDIYYADSEFDTVIEVAGQGYDIVYSSAYTYTLADNVEVLSLDTDTDSGVYAIGNAQTNTILGNSGNNLLDGGAGADDLSGLGGDDIFGLRAGEAHGDVIYEFNGNGAGSGDVLLFSGYGTLEQGASFQQIDATHWQITSWDGSIVETITMMPGYVLDPTQDVMFV